MTPTQEAAMRQALEALEYAQQDRECPSTTRQAITALKAALAEPRPIHECYGDCPTNPQTCPNPCNFEGRPRPVQEAVFEIGFGWLEDAITYPRGTKLYVAPPQRKPLTDEEIIDAVRDADLDWARGWALDETQGNRFATLARAIERAHGIGDSND